MSCNNKSAQEWERGQINRENCRDKKISKIHENKSEKRRDKAKEAYQGLMG